MEKFNPEPSELDSNKYRDNLAKNLKKIESHEDRKEILNDIKENSKYYKHTKENRSDINIIYDELMSDDDWSGIESLSGPETHKQGETKEAQILRAKVNGVDIVARRSLLVEDETGYKRVDRPIADDYDYSLIIESSSDVRRKKFTNEKASKLSRLIFDRNSTDMSTEKVVSNTEVDKREIDLKAKKTSKKLKDLEL